MATLAGKSGTAKTLDFAKGKLTDDVKKSRTTLCVTQLEAFKKSPQP